MNATRLPKPTEQRASAPVTVCAYMKQAEASVDEQFGDGYAAAHPELVAAFIQAAASERLSDVLHDHLIPALDAQAD